MPSPSSSHPRRLGSVALSATDVRQMSSRSGWAGSGRNSLVALFRLYASLTRRVPFTIPAIAGPPPYRCSMPEPVGYSSPYDGSTGMHETATPQSQACNPMVIWLLIQTRMSNPWRARLA